MRRKEERSKQGQTNNKAKHIHVHVFRVLVEMRTIEVLPTTGTYSTLISILQDRSAKTVIPLLHLNVMLNGPGLEGHPNSMLIAFWDERCQKTRHIFVYAELGKVWCV